MPLYLHSQSEIDGGRSPVAVPVLTLNDLAKDLIALVGLSNN